MSAAAIKPPGIRVQRFYHRMNRHIIQHINRHFLSMCRITPNTPKGAPTTIPLTFKQVRQPTQLPTHPAPRG